MKQDEFMYSIDTAKTFDDAVVAVLKAVDQKGWAIFQVYDIQERLAAKGFSLEKLKIIEICSAKYAGRLLSQNKNISLCMPCKINVIEDKGKVRILTMKPSVIGLMFEWINSSDFVDVERDLKEMVDLAR